MSAPERGPERLLSGDDPLLAAAREDAPPADLEARILAKMPAGGGGGSSGGSKLPWKLGLGGAAGAGVVAWLLHGPAAAPPPPAPVAEPAPVVVSAATATAEPEPAKVDVAKIEEPVAKAEPVAPPVARPRPPPSVSAAPVASAPLGLGAEIKALDAVRSSMNAGDPSGALASLDAYDRSFPQGTLKQEAVLLRIDALMRAGRTEEARKLGHAFLAEHPSTPHKKRISTLLREGE